MEAYVPSGKIINGPASQLQGEPWLVAVRQDWDRLFGSLKVGEEIRQINTRMTDDQHEVFSRAPRSSARERQEFVFANAAVIHKQARFVAQHALG